MNLLNEVRIDPATGKEFARATYPRKIKYKGLSKTIQMPGWYTKDGSDAIFTKEDLKEYDAAIKQLKEEYQNSH